MNNTPIRRLTLLRVALDIRLPPSLSRLICTLGMPFWSKLAFALDTRSPVMMTSRSSHSLALARSGLRYSNRCFSDGGASMLATRRNSRLATLPRIRLASAVSWMPGSSTTIRFWPWRWTSGSDTPSSFTRLRRVVRFWATEYSAISLRALSGRLATRFQLSPASTRSRDSWDSASAIASRACSRSASVLNLASIVPSLVRLTNPRIRSSRRVRLMALVKYSMRRSIAESTSTSSMKCTPPLRSRPSFIGLAP